MRLKRLEISGFKTFREKVTLEFSPGVSGIIGPNGCGKSNIVDAIRWVMGEQRIKALRGKKMDDVIFSGSETAAPVGMAEVTMTMLSDGQPFSGSYRDCHEVTVSRRIYREGDSEYYLNKVPCRMLDVREFFMDTGVGTRTYSLVEQNSVSTLVEAKPEDRRQFIEEAAGIAKYKSRKEAAMRKMEATQQNMARLHDIMKEVKTQLNQVSRQAKRAEQYRVLRKEMKEAELALARITYADLMDRKDEKERELAFLREKARLLKADMDSREAAFEELKVSSMEADEVTNRGREKLYECKNTIKLKEQSLEYSRRRIDELTVQKKRDCADIQTREERLVRIREELAGLQAQSEDLQSKVEELESGLVGSQGQLEELRIADGTLQKKLEILRGSRIDMAAEKAKLNNMVANLIKNLEDIRKRRERYMREMEDTAGRRESLITSLDGVIEALKQAEEDRETLQRRHGSLLQEIGTERALLRERDESIASFKDQRSRKSARLSSLQEFQEGYSWCSEGIQRFMKSRKQGKGEESAQENGSLGLVADHIDVPREYETAVEALLGEKLQYVVVRSQEDGISAIDYLKQTAAGRGTFVPLEVRTPHQPVQRAAHLENALPLLDQVQVNDSFRDIIRSLLGDVLLIPNLETGISLWRQNGFHGSFVTPEGDIVNSQGILTGGSRGKGERSLLANKREIGELRKETARLTRALEEAEADKRRLVASIGHSEEELQGIKAELHQAELRMNSRSKDRERFEDELKRLEERRSIVEFDHETVALAETENREKLEKVKQEQETQGRREKDISAEMDLLTNKREELRGELSEQEKDYTAGKVLLATQREKIVAGRKAMSALEESRVALIREIGEKKADQEKSVHQEEELSRNIANDRDVLTSLYQEFEQAEKTFAELNQEHQEKEGVLKSQEREIKEIKRNLDRLIGETNEKEIALREVAFQFDALQRSFQERHGVDLEEVTRNDCEVDSRMKDQLLEKLEKSRSQIDAFGEVNLLALSEYEQLKERYDFLTTQEADIATSLSSLQRTIERINRISRARFAEAFEAVNACFQDMFNRIFPGGKGRLFLTDASEMLETGVEMDIQVPGKRARNVSLLSGGEKSLAAIALIFAILQYRPTPFLVLDEVDAALDDANVSLFNRLIRDVAQKSQVIMVTHNKVTMEVAENLYGVTMQNKGVSTLVSVSLN